jgi:hypothetical protein
MEVARTVFYYPATCFDIYGPPNMFIASTNVYMYVEVPIRCTVTPTRFTGVKAARAWSWPPTPSSAEIVHG